MATTCPGCGFENPPGMRFCGNCGSRLGEPAASLTPAPTPTPAAQASTPASLFERFQRAGIESAGQRRSVTVLFADLSGYTALSEQLDNEDVYFLIQEYLKLLAEIVYRYDGFVDKYTGDGIMALFGAPITAENNAEMAVRAALDMHADLARLSARLPGRAGVELYMRIGLHAGSVVVGSVGSNLQMNYTAIGDTVNLASRLEQAARPGTILVSQSVRDQTQALFDFTHQAPLALKGIANLVQAYQVRGVRERPDSVRGLEGLRSPMIGRESEMAQLRAAMDRLAGEGRGGLAFISGEAGLGKTRLLSELKALVPTEKVQVFEAHSLTYRRSVSYWIFLDLLRNVLGVTPYVNDMDLQARLIDRMQRMLGERAAEILPLLERVLGLKPSNPSAEERLSQMEADLLHQRISLAFRDWLAAEAQRLPMLLILEDLHWADDASLELLQFLADSTRELPLLIFATSRSVEESALRETAERAGRRLGSQFLHVCLQTLSPDQSARLLDHLLSMLTLTAGLRREILQRADGNPFYLEEILRMLIDQGVIRREGGRLRMAPGATLESLGVPETLKGLILSRFDRLDPLQRQYLQVASAVGRRFNLALVKMVLALSDESAINEIVPRLAEREFISPTPDAPGSEYQFQHILVSDAIYSTLLSRNRAELHGRIGEAIEQLYAGHLEQQVDLLARHYGWSNRRERALHYLILAGRKAAASFLKKPARQYYEDALALLPDVEHSLEDELEVHTGLGDALLFLGDYARAREHFCLALSLAGTLSLGQQVQERSNLQCKIGTTYERQGDYDQALQQLNEALAALTGVSSRYPVERARVLNDIGYIYMRRGQLEEAETYFQRALWSVEPSSQPGVVASIYNRLGGVYYLKEDLKTASEWARKSLELRIETGDLAGMARLYNNLGILEMRQGQWDEALADFMRGVELNIQLNDVEGTAELHLNIGLLLCDKGELSEARRYLEECLQTGVQIGHSFLEAQSRQNLSYLCLVAGQWEDSVRHARASLGIYKDLGIQDGLIDLSLVIAEACIGSGRLDEAETACRELSEALQTRGDDRARVTTLARAGRMAGKIAWKRGELAQAREIMEGCAEQFTRKENALDLGRTLSDLAALALQMGDRGAAQSHASQARAIFTQLGAKLDLGRVVDPIEPTVGARP